MVPGAAAVPGGGSTIGSGAKAGFSVPEEVTGMLVAQPETSPKSKAQEATRGVDDAIRQWRKARRAVNKIAALGMPAIVFFVYRFRKAEGFSHHAVQPLIQQRRFE
jgi:hypothetical protein